jgi:uncharacterized lipoprotein YmbA
MRLLAYVPVLLVLACGGSVTPNTLYLLRAEAPGSTVWVEGPPRVGLGRVVIAPYLDQSGVVLETAPREVTPARDHQWAEPLDEALELFLRDEISNALGEQVGVDPADRDRWVHTVNVFVQSFHGTLEGTAVLDAFYRIESRAGKIETRRFARSQPLAREGYGGLVDAQADLARQLARAIADALREIGGP